MKSSIGTWGEEPTPLVAWKTPPRRAFIQATKPGRSWTGAASGFTTSTLGVVTASVTGAKSATGS